MHFPRAATAEKLLSEGVLESYKTPTEQHYENMNQRGTPVVNPLEYLFLKSHYHQNEDVENGMECDVLVIKPGHSKSKASKSEKKRRERLASFGHAQCTSVDSHHGMPVYDSLDTNEILGWNSRNLPNDDNDGRIIHTIVEVPSADERSEKSSIDRTRTVDRKLSESSLDSESKEAISIIDNDFIFLKDWKTETEETDFEEGLRSGSKSMHSPRVNNVLQMEEQTGLFGFFNCDTLNGKPVAIKSDPEVEL